MKVVLFCPVRQSPDVFRLAVESHAALKGISERWYSDGNDDAKTSDIVKAAADQWWIDDASDAPKYDFRAHAWPHEVVSHIARIRNQAIHRFLASDADALFMVDSDVIVHPSLVEHLASLDLPIACEVYWSQWTHGSPWQPNVWDGHKYSFRSPESIIRLKEPGQYRVGGFGACTLIRRDVFEKGVRYDPVEGLADMWGEDRWFSIRAAVLDIPIHADTVYPPFHIYRPEQLEEARTWFDCGCPGGYFRETKLTEEWAEQIVHSFKPQRKPSILLITPGQTFSQAWVSAYAELIFALTPHFDIKTQMGFSSNIYVTRKCLLDTAKTWEHKPDYILWIDDDQLLSVEGLQHLITDLERCPDLSGVAGWAWCVRDVYGDERHLSFGVFDEDGEARRAEYEGMLAHDNDLILISYTGFPAVLMRGSVLDRMEGDDFLPLIGPQYKPWGILGEDASFFHRACEKGLQFAVDRRVKVPHLKLRCAEPVAVSSLEGAPVQVERTN